MKKPIFFVLLEIRMLFMKYVNQFVASIFMVLAFSCVKEQRLVPSDKEAPETKTKTFVTPFACAYGLQGIYTDLTHSDTVFSNAFVSNGIAQLKNSPYPYYFSTIRMWTSASHCGIGIGGDTAAFEVRLKNPSTDVGAIAFYDVSISIVGTVNTATLTFIGDASHQIHTRLTVGNQGITNTPALIRKFEDWSVVTLRVTSRRGLTLTAEVDGAHILSTYFPISANMKIGEIQDLRVLFKGPGSVDWMKIKSSKPITDREWVFRNQFNTNVGYDGFQWCVGSNPCPW